jgi:hypothetical protein
MVKIQHTMFQRQVWSQSTAYFFQNNCHYMMAIYTVIKPRMSCLITHILKKAGSSYENFTTHQLYKHDLGNSQQQARELILGPNRAPGLNSYPSVENNPG